MRSLIIVIAFVVSAVGLWSGIANAQTGNGRPTPYVPHVMPPEASGPPRIVRTLTPTRPEPEISDETIKLIASAAFITLASSTIILFILGCGSRVVVFADGSDAIMTACIFIAPIVTALALLIFATMMGYERVPTYPSVWAFAKDSPILAFTLGVGLLWWAWAMIGTVLSSIRHNGLVIGSLVALMKFGATFTILFAWFASEHARTPDYRGYGPHLIFLGILAWFASRYVNGHRVMERRKMMIAGREASIAQA